MKRAICYLLFLIFVFTIHSAFYSLQAQEKTLDSLEKVLLVSKDPKKQIDILNQIGRIKENNDLISAKSYYSRALKISENINYIEGKLTYYENYTYLLDVEGKNDSALLLKQKAVILAIAFKDPNLLGNAYSNLANTFFNQSKYDSSLKYNQIALPYIEKSNDIRKEILFKANIGLIYEKLKDFNKAKEYLDWAVKKSRASKQEFALMTSLNQMAVVLIQLKKYDEAEKANLEALGISKKLNNLQYQGFCYLTQAEICRVKKNTAGMKTNLSQGIKVSEQLGYLGNVCTAKTGLGLAYIFEKNLKMAKKLTLESYQLALDNNLVAYQEEATLQLLGISIAEGNISKINEYNDLYNKTKEKINLEAQAISIKDIEAKYQTEKKQNQILKLEKEKQQQNTLIYGLLAAIFIVGLLGFIGYRNINYRRKLAEKEVTALQQEQQLTATESIIKGQEEERSRLARDLHDGLGGILSSLKYSLTSMTGNLVMPEQSGRLFNKSLETLETAITEMRRVAHSMMPETLIKFGLVDAIRNYCDGINQSAKLQVNLQVYGLEKRLEPTVEITIYRIVQELLNNSLKHADATKALVQITKTPENLLLTVEDNGKGFDKNDLTNKKGIGLSNIESRVTYLNGTLEVTSSPGNGTSVIMEFKV